MLPHIHPKERHIRLRDRILVFRCDDLQPSLRASFTHEPTPSTALNAEKRGLEGIDEFIDGPPSLDDGSLQRRRCGVDVDFLGAGWTQILPEERVIDVATAIEFDFLLQ